MRDDLRVPTNKLRKVFNPADLPFEDTSEVEPAGGFIGQERAMPALELGLRIDSPEYNIFIINDTGISRKSVLLDYLNKFVEEETAAAEIKVNLRDFCYIFNFENPDRPIILTFNQGDGGKFKKDAENLLRGLQKRIPAILNSEECVNGREQILQELDEEKKRIFGMLQKIFEEVNEKEKEANFLIISTPEGNKAALASKNQSGQAVAMSQKKYDSLPKEEKKRLDEIEQGLTKNVDKVFRKMNDLEKEAQDKIEELEKNLTEKYLESFVFKALCRKKEYATFPEALKYFKGLKEYVSNNIHLLFREECKKEPNGFDPFLPFRVNLFVDNSQTKKTPIIFEENPNFGNLFGRMDKNFVQGVLLTDHTKIKAGSLALADGGYLVLNVLDVLKSPGVWEKLEKTIRYGYLKIEDPASYIGLVSTNPSPEPMPVRLKVVLVGEQTYYHLLFDYDPEFSAIFKIKVELNSEMPLTQDSEKTYDGFIALCCKKEDLRRERNGLLPFDRSAVSKIREYGLRLADNQTKFSTKFNKIKELIIESDYWASKAGSGKVSSEHVKKALEAKRVRANLTESKLQELIKEEVLLLDTQGEKVGQINGLVVYSLADYSFGLPSRITVQTFLGKKGLVSIDREVKMTGPIHDKGIQILQGYFNGRYGKSQNISFSASVCFEQSYHGVEGDSASAAELFCLISSLSDLPINQKLAVTGSVNQFGEIQPIGGVNEKIEGFFDVCKERGLTGSQGVIIPHQNVKNLMLREDVVEACAEGKFSVFAISTIDEGLELLTSRPVEEVHQKVRNCLLEMTEMATKNKAPDAS